LDGAPGGVWLYSLQRNSIRVPNNNNFPIDRSNRFVRRPPLVTPPGVGVQLAQRLVGQTQAIELVVPYVRMFQAGLAPEGRPAGVFLLLGPTGTGKTRTVEALAEVMHGSEKNVLRIDCGEFQMEHEVAKLIGAPPGYLGHRETQPMLTQQKVNAVASERSSLSIVLFDEIEKAASSLNRLLLGVLDKAALKLGDNSTVNFERTMIFMTSNLGAEAMMNALAGGYGFARGMAGGAAAENKLEAIGRAAVRRRFSPEFLNRIDAVVTYHPLGEDALRRILEHQLANLQRHITGRLGARAFRLDISEGARNWLIEKGTSQEFGARELKRVILRQLTQPLAALVASNRVPPGSLVHVTKRRGGEALSIQPLTPDQIRGVA